MKEMLRVTCWVLPSFGKSRADIGSNLFKKELIAGFRAYFRRAVACLVVCDTIEAVVFNGRSKTVVRREIIDRKRRVVQALHLGLLML